MVSFGRGQTPGPLTRFRRDARGSVALMFAVSALPLIVVGGLAIDYSRFKANHTALQNATDAAVLAVTRTATATTSTSAMTQQAAAQIAAAMGDRSTDLGSGVTTTAGAAQVCLTTSRFVSGLFSHMVGLGAGSVTVTSCATMQGGGAFEVALVLDNTGSMSNSSGGKSKLESAKAAALALIQQLNPDGKPPTASISITPFSNSVNVGAGNIGMGWLDLSGQSSIHWQNHQRPGGAPWLPISRFDLMSQMGVSWAGCVEERPDPYLVTDTKADAANPDTLFVPYFWPDEGDLDGNGTAVLPGAPINGRGDGRGNTYSSSNWDFSGAQNSYLYDFGGVCTASASDPYEAADVADPVSRGGGATKLCKYRNAAGVSSATNRPGPNHNCFGNPLLTLTQDTAALTAKISSMTAGGTTNLLPGFMWGWRTISPNGPFAGAGGPKPYNTPGNAKIIVFMTDGFNNWSANDGYAYKSEYNSLGYYVNNRLSNYGGPTNPTPLGDATFDGATTKANWRHQMDAALLRACANAKAAGVLVYTIGFSIPGDQIDDQGLRLLQKCASDPGRAFVARDGSSLVNVFSQIGAGLGALRLVR